MALDGSRYAEEARISRSRRSSSAPHSGDSPHERLRSRFLASSWLPIPLGMFLWSVLHVMLLVAVFAFCVPLWLGTFIVCMYMAILTATFAICLIPVVCSIALALDLVRLLARSIGFCWSYLRFLAGPQPISERDLGFEWWSVGLWRVLKDGAWFPCYHLVRAGVPCTSDSICKETFYPMLELSLDLCKEVVHMHSPRVAL